MPCYGFTAVVALSTGLLAGLAGAKDWEQVSGQGIVGDGSGVATEFGPSSDVAAAEMMAANPKLKLYEANRRSGAPD